MIKRKVKHLINLACNDAKFWCQFLNSNSSLCNKYDIGIKICPKKCGKCNGKQCLAVNNFPIHCIENKFRFKLYNGLAFSSSDITNYEYHFYLDCKWIRRNNGCALGKTCFNKI